MDAYFDQMYVHQDAHKTFLLNNLWASIKFGMLEK